MSKVQPPIFFLLFLFAAMAMVMAQVPDKIQELIPAGPPTATVGGPPVVEPALPAANATAAPSAQLTSQPAAPAPAAASDAPDYIQQPEGLPGDPSQETVEKAAALAQALQIEGLQSEYDPITKIATARGNVRIVFENIRIESSKATYNSNTGDIIATEGVTVYKDGIIYRGEIMTYNIRTGTFRGEQMRSGANKLYYTASDLISTQDEQEIIELGPTVFTTHDSPDPNYRVKAKSMTIYPDDKVVFRNVTFYAGSVPVLWLPYYVQPMDEDLGYLFTPGYKGEWGGFLLNRYGVLWGDHTLAQFLLDFRSARGVGAGIDLFAEKFREKPNFGRLKLYYTNDFDPSLPNPGDPARAQIDPNRYKINFQHRIYLPGPDESTMYVDFDITKLSDNFILRDFFVSDFILDPQPDNTVQFVKNTDRFSVTAWSRFQVNEFYPTDTRLPEVAVDFTRQPLGKTGIFYQGQTSFGVYSQGLNEDNVQLAVAQGVLEANNATIVAQAAENAAAAAAGRAPVTVTPVKPNVPRASLIGQEFKRFHSYHELLYPKTYNGWLNVVPRAGAGYTQYFDANELTTDGGRSFLHAGMDVSFKLSRIYPNVKNSFFEIDQLKHVMQPYVNWSFLSASDAELGFVGIDTLQPTTRPRPIDVPLYPAIDSLTDWHVVRAGVRNQLFTKRDGQAAPLLSLNTYMDFFIDDPENLERSNSNLYNDFVFTPVPWLTLSLQTQLPIADKINGFSEVDTGLTWMPADWLELSISHLFLQDHPFFPDSSFLTTELYTRLGNNWGFSMRHDYEASDSRLISQRYTLHRDLTSWAASLGLVLRDRGDVLDQEVGVVLQFTLKDFPQLSIPLNVDPNFGSKEDGT